LNIPPSSTNQICHSDRRDGGFGRPGAEESSSSSNFRANPRIPRGILNLETALHIPDNPWETCAASPTPIARFLQRRVLGLPAQHVLEFSHCWQLAPPGRRGVAETACGEFFRPVIRSAVFTTSRLEKPLLIAHVERFSRNALDLFQRAPSANPQCRSRGRNRARSFLRRGISRSRKYRAARWLPGPCPAPGNQVRFFAMGFAARNAGARGIEIAQCHILQPGIGAVMPKICSKVSFDLP